MYIMVYNTKEQMIQKLQKKKADVAHSKWVHNVSHFPFALDPVAQNIMQSFSLQFIIAAGPPALPQ